MKKIISLNSIVIFIGLTIYGREKLETKKQKPRSRTERIIWYMANQLKQTLRYTAK